MLQKLLFLLILPALGSVCLSQDVPRTYKPGLFTTPLSYTAMQVKEPLFIDGTLAETTWQQAKWSEPFTDIEGDLRPRPTFQTRMKMLWDDSCLYVAAQLQEPHINARLLEHDTIVFYENDFEIFIDPDNDTHQYFEIEVNALNTIFDLFMTKPYRNRADALISYDVQGIRSAVQRQGTINNSSDTDSGWTVEMAIPFRAINFGYKKSFSPAPGSFYRINFSRVEWDWDIVSGNYVKRKDKNGRNLPEHNWVWSPQGVINMHFPERWGYLFFSNNQQASFKIPETEEAKNYLWLVYYKQKDFNQKSGGYALDLLELSIPPSFKIGRKTYTIALTGTRLQFVATLTEPGSSESYTINEDGKVSRQKRGNDLLGLRRPNRSEIKTAPVSRPARSLETWQVVP